MALILRHDPAKAGLVLDSEGWTPVADLLRGLAANGHCLTRDDLAALVEQDSKNRYALSQDGTHIRASQGHSAKDVALSFVAADPPCTPYHGTAASNLDVIMREGLSRMQRHHVHLSPDVHTAKTVGARHGKPKVLAINAAAMHAGGHVFYRSQNGVWLADAVPPRFLTVVG